MLVNVDIFLVKDSYAIFVAQLAKRKERRIGDAVENVCFCCLCGEGRMHVNGAGMCSLYDVIVGQAYQWAGESWVIVEKRDGVVSFKIVLGGAAVSFCYDAGGWLWV